jgi:hypothetical protein
LLREGRSNAEIALALQMGIETVRTHTRNVYRKLGVSSRRELIAPARSDELQSPPVPARKARPRASMLGPSRRRGHGSQLR